MRDRKPIPQPFKDFLEPVKPYIDKEPLDKSELIDRVAGRVEQPVLNFIKMFSFSEIRKMEDDELIIV